MLAGRVVANLVGAVEKKCGYRLHKRPEWMCRSQTKQPIGMFRDASVFCILTLSERQRSGMRPNGHLTRLMLILRAGLVQKKWLIYTRHIYFPNNLCKQLCSDTELCLKRAQVNGPSMSVMVDKQLISKLGLWGHSGDQVAPSRMDRARKISSSPAPVTSSQSGDQELCLQTLFQFTRAVQLGISGARTNDENKGPMSSFCVYCQSTCL